MVDLTLEIVGERNVIRNLDLMPQAIQAVILAKMEDWTERTANLVEDNIHSRLQERSGKLGQSVESEVTRENGGAQGRIWIDTAKVPYAKAQEDGAVIPPHMIFPNKGRVLAFMASNGEQVVATKVNHPGAIIQGVHYMRDAYRTMSPKLSSDLKKALVQGIRDRMRSGGGDVN